jgi:multisubunit Na+/H+ antiporter MnhE subunit
VTVRRQLAAGGSSAWFDREVGRRGRFLVIEAAAWWLLLFAGYLALVSERSAAEVILGASLSAAAAGTAMLARRVSGSSFAVPRGWVAVLVRLPAAVLVDTWVLVRLIWPVSTARAAQVGGLQALGLADQPDERRDSSLQAVAGLLLSLSPGSFVVDSSADPPKLVLHSIRASPGPLERSLQR